MSNNSVDLSGAVASSSGVDKYKRIVLTYVTKMAKSIIGYFKNPENWRRPKFWMLVLVLLRAMYVIMLEYGLHPFKKNLKGDHVFLTGAGGGIGRLMAIKLGKLGCKLSLCDIQEGLLAETKQVLLKNNIPAENICIFKIDMCSYDSIKAGAATARAAFGDISVLINNAGVVSGKSTLELSDAEIDRTLQVNTISHLHTIKEFLPAMIKNKRGHIVTVASIVGIVAAPAIADYAASKFGAVGLDESLRYELRGQGLNSFIKTTCICPYLINTGMFDGTVASFPFSLLEPDEVATRVVHAIGQEEASVVIPWRGNLVYLTKLCPTEFNDNVSSWLGATSAMDNFKGRDVKMPGLDSKN